MKFFSSRFLEQWKFTNLLLLEDTDSRNGMNFTKLVFLRLINIKVLLPTTTNLFMRSSFYVKTFFLIKFIGFARFFFFKKSLVWEERAEMI